MTAQQIDGVGPQIEEIRPQPAASRAEKAALGFVSDFEGLVKVARGRRSRWWAARVGRLAVALIGVGIVQLARHDDLQGLLAAPLARAQLAASASSICAEADADENAIHPSATAIAIYGSAVDAAEGPSMQDTEQEISRLRALRPAADVAAQWQTFMAAVNAYDRMIDTSLGPNDQNVDKILAETKTEIDLSGSGYAAQRKLGISCDLLVGSG
jgi:hypothetical protein